MVYHFSNVLDMQVDKISAQWVQKGRDNLKLSVLLFEFAELIKRGNHLIVIFIEALDDDLLVARFFLKKECKKVLDQKVVEFHIKLRVRKFLLADCWSEKVQVLVANLSTAL